MDENEKIKMNVLDEKAKECFAKLTDSVNSLAKSIMNAFKEYLDLFKAYPNKRVKRNALHHPKENVRKKNMNRIFKWMAKQMEKQKKQKGSETHGNQKGC